MLASDTGSSVSSSMSLPDIDPLTGPCALVIEINASVAINNDNSFFVVDIVFFVKLVAEL